MVVETDQILKAILDHSPENIVLMGRNFEVICFNERMRQILFEYHHRYIKTGDDYRDFVVEKAMPTFLRAFDKALNDEITIVELETVAEHLTLWFQYRVNPVYTTDGKLLGVSLSAQNVTVQKQAQLELAESEAKFRALVEQSMVGVFILKSQQFLYVNPAFEKMVAVDAVKLLSAHQFIDFIHDDDEDYVNQRCESVLLGKRDNEHMVMTAIRSDGELRSVEIAISRILFNGKLALLGSALDITGRVDEEIRINEAVDRAQENERMQLGMELHDNVKQQLLASLLNLQLCQELIPMEQDGHDLLEKSIGYLQEAAQDLRLLSHRLAPEVDEDTRMLEKINDLIDRMNVKGKLKVTIDIEDTFSKANPKLQLVVYRIIQEQFTNIISYSHASNARIRVFMESKSMFIGIVDDGVGFDLSKATGGIGLQNIRRRVHVLGGNVRIRSSPGTGFSLTATIPF